MFAGTILAQTGITDPAAWIVGLISGLITGFVTCLVFYVLSGRDLKKEADDLRKLNVLIIRAMENARIVAVNWDADGRPIGLIHRLDASGGITLSGSALAEVRMPDAGDTAQ